MTKLNVPGHAIHGTMRDPGKARRPLPLIDPSRPCGFLAARRQILCIRGICT